MSGSSLAWCPDTATAEPSLPVVADERGGWGPAEALPRGPNGMNGDWTGESRVAGAAAGSRPAHPGAPGARSESRWDKFRSGERSVSLSWAEDREGSGASCCRPPGPETFCPKCLTLFSLTCDSGSSSGGWGVGGFLSFPSMEIRCWGSEGAKSVVQLTEEGLCGLVALRASTALNVREPQSPAGKSGRVGTIGPSACLSPRGGGYQGRFSDSGVV